MIAAVPGLVVILLNCWFRKRKISFFVRVLPSMLAACGSIYFLYYSLKMVRGFEGAAYGFLAFFLMCFSVEGYVIAAKKPSQRQQETF